MKARIRSGFLAAVILTGAVPICAAAETVDPVQQNEIGAVSRVAASFAVSASEDVTASVGEEAIVQVTVSGLGSSLYSYNTYDLKLTYDTGLLTFVSGSAPDDNAVVTENNGEIRVLGYGVYKTISTAAVTLRFTAKAGGSAKVTIRSAVMDIDSNARIQDAPAALILDDTTVITVSSAYSVTLGEGLSAENLVATSGEDYTFKATDYHNYDYAPTAVINGGNVAVIDNGDGTYTIPGAVINGPITITANRTPKTYGVTISGQNVTGAKMATYNTPYVFKISKEDGYSYTVKVTIGGKAYTGYSEKDGIYTIPGTDITGAIKITVTTAAAVSNKVNVTFIGSGAMDGSGAKKAELGVKYPFKVNKKAGYTYTVSVRVNGVDVGYDYDDQRDIYYVLADKVTGDITIVITKAATVEIAEYITLNEQSMYLILFNGDLKQGQVPVYDGQSMYWSDRYGAYAWLAISDRDKMAVKQTAEEKITIGAGEAAAIVNNSGNVNLSFKTDVSDAQLAYDMYNARYTLADMEMIKFLNADVNTDKKVDTKDAAEIISIMLADGSA